MKDKFLNAVINRCIIKLNSQPFDKGIYNLGIKAYEVLLTPDAIEDQAQAHGEGRLQRILTAYCGACDNIERYQQLEVVDDELTCTKCGEAIILNANNIVYHKAKTARFTAYEEQHSKGFISIENILTLKAESDLGIQIAKDGRVWINIDGISFMRFKPKEGN